jgi:hypothetical protein
MPLDPDEVRAAVETLQRERTVSARDVARHLNKKLFNNQARVTEDEAAEALNALVGAGEYETVDSGTPPDSGGMAKWPGPRPGYRPIGQ